MLKRVVDTKWNLISGFDIAPLPSEISLLSKLVDILAPIEEVFQALQDETTPAISHILPLIQGLTIRLNTGLMDLQSKLANQSTTNHDSLRVFLCTLLDKIRNRLLVLRFDPLYIASSCLHPVYKLRWTDCIIYDEEEQKELQKKSMEYILQLMMEDVEASDLAVPATGGDVVGASEFRGYKPSVLSYLKKSQPPEAQQRLTCPEELEKYLRSHTIESNPLLYWKDCTEYPRLRTVARRLLTAPGSTAGIERIFNFCGILLSEKRQRTDDLNFENLIMAKVNLAYAASYTG